MGLGRKPFHGLCQKKTNKTGQQTLYLTDINKSFQGKKRGTKGKKRKKLDRPHLFTNLTGLTREVIWDRFKRIGIMAKSALTIVTGSYGSGKTEYAVNLAAGMKKAGQAVTLVDLDVVNPYFRTRDVRDAFEKQGIGVVAPEGHFSHADLPMLSPRVKGAIRQTDIDTILDVGGDPMGARVLARFCQDIEQRGYEMILVANTRRPDTRTKDDILVMLDMIQKTSGLVVNTIVANTHLMAQTGPELVREGVDISRSVALERGLKFAHACILEEFLDRMDPEALDAEAFIMKKFMKKPWEQTTAAYRC